MYTLLALLFGSGRSISINFLDLQELKLRNKPRGSYYLQQFGFAAKPSKKHKEFKRIALVASLFTLPTLVNSGVTFSYLRDAKWPHCDFCIQMNLLVRGPPTGRCFFALPSVSKISISSNRSRSICSSCPKRSLVHGAKALAAHGGFEGCWEFLAMTKHTKQSKQCFFSWKLVYF